MKYILILSSLLAYAQADQIIKGGFTGRHKFTENAIKEARREASRRLKGSKGSAKGSKGSKSKGYYSLEGTFGFIMNAAQEEVFCDAKPAGAGSGYLVFDDGQVCIYGSITGLGEDLTGLHIHGPAGFDESAPVLADLTMEVDGENIKSCTDPNEPMEDLMLLYKFAEDGLLYMNARTASCPDGQIRGQVL